MTKRKLVNTDLIVRYLVQDHEKPAKAAAKLFDACDRGEVVIVLLLGEQELHGLDQEKLDSIRRLVKLMDR